MTRHSYLISRVAFCCLAVSLSAAQAQVPVGDLVQDGEYGMTPTYESAPMQSGGEFSSGGDYGGNTTYGNGSEYQTPYAGEVPYSSEVPYSNEVPYSGEPQMNRLPQVAAPTGMLKDVPCGYPGVVTETNQMGGWGNQAFMPAPPANFTATNPALQGNPLAPRLPQPVADRPGLYFSYDALYGTISAPSFGGVGHPDAEGIFTTNGLPNPFFNSVSTDIIDSQPEFGHRIEFGCLGCQGGFIASYFNFNQDKGQSLNGGMVLFDDPWGTLRGYSDGNGDGIDDDINGNRVHGRNGQDLGIPNPLFNPPINTDQYQLAPDGSLLYDGIPETQTGTDFGDLLTFIPIFDTLTVRNVTDIDGFDFVFAKPRKGCKPCCNGAMMLYGLRVLDIDEDFTLRGTGSFFDETNIRAQIDNLIIGPTIGFNLCKRFGKWRFDGLLKSTFGINFRRANQYGEIASNAGASTETHNVPVNLAPSAFSNVNRDEEFAPIIEWRAGLAYCCTDWVSARIGYTGMFVDGISRAASATNYTLPAFGLNTQNDSLNFNALTFGFEFYR